MDAGPHGESGARFTGRRDARGALPRRPGLHHRESRIAGHSLHTRAGENHPAGRRVAALAGGRPGRCDRRAGGRRPRKTGRGRRRRIRRSRRPDGRFSRRPQGPDRRGTVRRRHHPGHAARELVDGQEPGGDAVRAAGQGRHVFARTARAGPALAKARRPAQRDPEYRPAADERGAEVPRQSGARLECSLSRPLLHLHRRDRRLRLLDHAAAGISAQHRWPLSQFRSADHHVSREARRHEARRELPHLATTGTVRSHRHSPPGPRDRSVREFPDHRIRLRHRAQLGADRPALSSGRRVAGTALAARGLDGVREHAGAGVEAPGIRRVLLAEPDRDVEPAARDLLRCRCRRPEHLDRAVAGSRHRPHGPYARATCGTTRHESCARPGDGGGGRRNARVTPRAAS